MMRKICFATVFSTILFILAGCSSAKVGVPKSIICAADGICEVADPFDARAEEINSCLINPGPAIKKTYEGHALFLRAIGIDAYMNDGRARTGIAVARYFNILEELYFKKYQKRITLTGSYRVDREQDKEGQRISTSVSIALPGITPLTNIEVASAGWVSCFHFNIDRYLRIHVYPFLPQTLQRELEGLLPRGKVKFNQEVQEGKNKMVMGEGKKLKVDFKLPSGGYHQPTAAQRAGVLKRFQNYIKKRGINFCGDYFHLDTTTVSCHNRGFEYFSELDILRLKHLKNLDTLDLKGSRFKGVDQLKALKNLTGVDIRGTGIARDLKLIERLRRAYQHLDIPVTKLEEHKTLFKKSVKGCETDGVRCRELAEMFEKGFPFLQDFQQAEEYFIKGCDLGDYSSCINVSTYYQKGKRGVVDEERSRLYLKKGFDIGWKGCKEDQKCDRVISILKKDQKLNVTPEQHLYLTKIRCNQGDQRGCLELGTLYKKMGKKYQKEQYKAYLSGCKQQDGESCFAAGKQQRDEGEAFKLYFDGCGYGFDQSCLEVAKLWFRSKKRFQKRYSEYELSDPFKRGCELKNSNSCVALGKEKMGDRNFATAQLYFTKGCNLGSAEGCSYSGLLFEKGANRAPELVKEAYLKGCNGGHSGGCAALGRITLKEGKIDEAKGYFKKGCDLKYQKSCEQLKKIEKKVEKKEERKKGIES